MSERYENIRDTLNTGDIVLCSGKGTVSTLIKAFTGSQWSHVAMVLRLATEFDFVLCWESTTLGKLRDVYDGQPKKGVQLVPLSERIATYEGKIAIRRLTGVELGQTAIQSLNELRKELRGKPYETDRIELLKSAYEGFGGLNEEDLSSVFCSELVAEAYQRLGLVSDRKPSNEYIPADFSQSKELSLLKGQLGEEVLVTN